MIVAGREAVDYAESRFGYSLAKLGPYAILAVKQGDKILAAMVFHYFTGSDIHVSVASSGHLPRRLIKAAGDYVFRQLKCRRATLITESHKVVEYGQRLGARLEGMAQDHYGEGRDGYRLAFLTDSWKH